MSEKVNEIAPLPLAAEFLLAVLKRAPYIYRYDGEYWFVRSGGCDYWLTEREHGFILIKSPL